jgi:hypothetical protein
LRQVLEQVESVAFVPAAARAAQFKGLVLLGKPLLDSPFRVCV